MSDSASSKDSVSGTAAKIARCGKSWVDFWFGDSTVVVESKYDWPRLVLAITAFFFFASAFSDASYWYAVGGAQSSSNVAQFLVTAGLQDDSSWSVSPLYLFESVAVYYSVLAVGAILSLFVAAGRGGRPAASALWIVFVCVANRQLVLSGIGEKVLSLGLFALAIGPTYSRQDVWSFFSRRLMSVQVTIFAAMTFFAMASREVWWNGLGAFGLAAPAENRLFDLTETVLANQTVYEALSLVMLLAIPVGLFLAWRSSTQKIGIGILVCWAVLVAVLGSHWMYAGAFIGSTLSIKPPQRNLP